MKDFDINHFQSSGAMESACAQSFFFNCQLKSTIKDALYIESFKNVPESKPYGDNLILCKLQCVDFV